MPAPCAASCSFRQTSCYCLWGWLEGALRCWSLHTLFHLIPPCLDGALSVLTVAHRLRPLGREIDEDAVGCGRVLRLYRSANDGFRAGGCAGGAGRSGPAEVCERGGGQGAVEGPRGAERMDARRVTEGQIHSAGPPLQDSCGGEHVWEVQHDDSSHSDSQCFTNTQGNCKQYLKWIQIKSTWFTVNGLIQSIGIDESNLQ